MAGNVIGHATLNVVPSTKGFGSALNGDLGPIGDSGGKTLGGKVGGAFKSVIGPLMAAAGAVGVGMFVSSSIKAAGALEQSVGAMNTVFKGSEAAMGAWSKGASTAVGLAANDYNNLAVLLGSQLKNAGTPLDELAGKTNTLVTAGADMASMFGGTTKEAVEAISSALKGERDPIEKYGVSLKQTTIDAKAAELGFTKVGGSFDAQAQSAATLALIMEQTADAQGNFAKESSTYEGTMQRLGASWQNVIATVGQGFLPIATAAGSLLLGMMPSVQGLADRFAALAPAVQGVVDAALKGDLASIRTMLGLDGLDVPGILQAIPEWLAANLPAALDAIAGAFAAFAPSVLDALAGAFRMQLEAEAAFWPEVAVTLTGALATLAPSLVDTAVGLFGTLAEAVVQIVPPLVTSLLSTATALVSAILGSLPAILAAALALFTGLVEGLVAVAPVLLSAVLDLLPVLIETLLGMLPSIQAASMALFLGILTAWLASAPSILSAWVDAGPALFSTIIGMQPELIDAALRLFTGIVEALPVVIPLVMSATLGLLPSIISTLLGLIPAIVQAAVALLTGLVSGLVQSAASVGAALFDLVGQAIRGMLSFLGIHSPSRLFRGYGENVGQGFGGGLASTETAIGSGLATLADAAADAVDGHEMTPDLTFDFAPGSIADRRQKARERAAAPRPTPRPDGHPDTRSADYYDYSTSGEDKTAKLARARAMQMALVAA